MERQVTFKIAAISDIHIGRQDKLPLFEKTFTQMLGEHPDVIILAGDIAEHGTVDEARIAAPMLRVSSAPVFAVFGNHDHWGNQSQIIRETLERDGGVYFLDGNAYSVHKDGGVIGITGIEGYSEASNGRDRKSFDLETPEGMSLLDFEVKKLENGLQSLPDAEKNIAVLHYAPDDREELTTLHGEEVHVFPFLGSRRFGALIDQHNAKDLRKVVVIFHGHADKASKDEGQTEGGVPVYSVSMIAAEKQRRQLYKILDVSTTATEEAMQAS